MCMQETTTSENASLFFAIPSLDHRLIACNQQQLRNSAEYLNVMMDNFHVTVQHVNSLTYPVAMQSKNVLCFDDLNNSMLHKSHNSAKYTLNLKGGPNANFFSSYQYRTMRHGQKWSPTNFQRHYVILGSSGVKLLKF